MEPIVRMMRATDLPAVAAMFDRLSDVSRYRRFFSPGTAGPQRELAYLPSVDGHARLALVATVDEQVVGVARYHVGAPGEAEVAVVVEDEWQHHGLGRRLMTELARAARREDVMAFAVSVLGDNAPAMRLLRRLAPSVAVGLDHGVFEATVPLAS